MNDKCYVYIIFDMCGIPRYVGKGQKNRWKVHARKVTNPKLAELYKIHPEIPIIKVRDGLSSEEACSLERLLISVIGRESELGPLFNKTAGGQGVLAPEPDTRQKISAKHAGKTLSLEHRKLLSEKAKARTPEVAAKILASRLGKMAHTAETKAKMSATRRGMVKSPEHLAALKKSLKGRVIGPMPDKWRKKIGAALKGKPWTEERRARAAQRRAAILSAPPKPFGATA